MKRKKQAKKWLLGTAIMPGLLFIWIYLGYHLAFRGKIYPGVKIAGQNLGNRTLQKAAVLLNQSFLSLVSENYLSFETSSLSWEIPLSEFNFTYLATPSAQKAYQAGRTGRFWPDLNDKITAWFKGINLQPVYQYDQKRLEAQIASFSAQILVPAVEPEIKINNENIIIKPGRAGVELDHRQLINILANRFAHQNFASISLPLNRPDPQPSPEKVLKTQNRAERFINQQINFIHKEKVWPFVDQDLVKLLSFNGGFDQKKIASHVSILAQNLNRPAQNAVFSFENGRVIEFSPAQPGYSLSQGEAVKIFIAALAKIENSFPNHPSPTEITLPVKMTLPDITIDQVNNLGIKELLSRGVSYYRGSPAARIHNLNLAAEKFNGLLVPPGEIFSFNQNLGEVSPVTGYQSALVIKEGKTILDDGGGVCQVSTSFFRAILNAGLQVIERHPHSFRVFYYEQGGFGPGLDATVWQPGVDLQFQNDTPAYLLIQTKINPQNYSLTFEIYGSPDKREVFLSSPKIWEQTAPPPDLYLDDPALPQGTIKQIEKAVNGAKVSVDWRVTRGNEILQEKTFWSFYQPWQAVYLKGTGPVL